MRAKKRKAKNLEGLRFRATEAHQCRVNTAAVLESDGQDYYAVHCLACGFQVPTR